MVVERLCERHSIYDDFAIQPCGGYPEVRKTLIALLNFEDDEKRKERIGVIVDADVKIVERWQSLCDVLRKKGFDPPKKPQHQGTILVVNERPRVGIWLMPDNSIPGILENFVAFLIQPEDKVWAHGLASIANLPERRFRDADEAKAQIHTWLAWQDPPGIQMSQAIMKKSLLANENETTRNFLVWLKAVFGP